jgi:hypothetical protein
VRKKLAILAVGLLPLGLVAAPLLTTSASAAGFTNYEAESSANTLSGGAKVGSCSSCSGGHKVGYVGNNSGVLQFNGVNSSSSGSVAVSVYYINGGATRTAQISVNGGSASTKSFATTGSWSTVGSLDLTLTLRSGSNTIRISGNNGYAPDFDRIAVASGTTSSPPPSSGGPTAAQLLAKVTSCSQISSGKYKTDDDAGSATVPVCGKNGAFFYKADMDVDCDGQRTTQCNENTDCCFQNGTAFEQSNGQPLNAATLPYVVIPSESSIFRYSQHGVDGGSVVAVIYNNQVEYAVIGDTGPTQIAGEASYATAKGLGINPDPSNGGVDSGVTYIFFEGSGAKVSPIENHSTAVSVGQKAAQNFINNN